MTFTVVLGDCNSLEVSSRLHRNYVTAKQQKCGTAEIAKKKIKSLYASQIQEFCVLGMGTCLVRGVPYSSVL